MTKSTVTTRIGSLVVSLWLMAASATAQPQNGAASAPDAASRPGQDCVCDPEVLHALPSPDGVHLQQILAMPANSWLILGEPKADPGCGSARGRTWTSKMAFAPSLGGAFLFGEGVHGWFNPSTRRYMDDLWFYDGRAHRWICVYPGTDVDDPGVRLDATGLLVDADGQPRPVATMVHGYEMTTFDPDTGRLMTMPNPGSYWREALSTIEDILEKSVRLQRDARLSPWFFDVDTLRWDRRLTSTRAPRSHFGDTLIYVPSQKRAFFRHKKQVWFYDAQANAWERVEPSGPPLPFGIDATACYDPKRERIYMGGGGWPVAEGQNALWIYDLKTDAWIDPEPAGSPNGDRYSTNHAVMHCDLANDVVVLVRHSGGDRRGVYVYDPVRNAWQTATRDWPSEWIEHWSRNAVSGYYDPQLNAHFFLVAGDSRDNGFVAVYRYGRSHID